MNPSTFISFFHDALNAYTKMYVPILREFDIPQVSFDILMFLGNNPQYQTARDIVKIRNIKANLISINVEKLVKEGYLRREEIKGDRRKTKLIITEKAHPVIKEGQQLQQGFVDQLFDNTTQEDKKIFIHVMKNMDKNLDDILKGGN